MRARASRVAAAAAVIGLAALAAAALPACVGPGDFRCTRHEQCGTDAFCESDGRCSVADPRCATGRRYVHEAGSAADACVGDSCPGNPIRAITAGAEHACLLRSDGGVFCWGRNDEGQLGDGTRTPRSTAVRVPGLTAIAVAAGTRHTCAISADGQVLCWGADDAGQLGDGGGVDRRTPVPVAGLAGATDVAAGDAFSCAVLADGSARCWGDDTYGQLGDATPPAAGARPPATVALTGLRALSAHWQHACALRDDETVWCWGSNSFGQLGDGSSDDRSAPVRAQSLASATRVATGLGHTCAATRADGLYCWGYNKDGQLGSDDPTSATKPTPVTSVPDAIAVAAGAQHTCAVRRGGATMCWGNNNGGQLGEGTTTALPEPVQVSGPDSGAGAAVVAGTLFSCAETRDGAVFCWGDNHYGQLGIGTEVVRPRAAPVPGLTAATDVAAGEGHSCAIGVADGVPEGTTSVVCWGANQNGQLGDNDTADRASAVATKPPVDDPAAVAAGGAHTCARTNGGALYCWGLGSSGQLGLGPDRTTAALRPALVLPTEMGVASVAAGDAHTCAAVAGGAALCFGADGDGQLGDGATADRATPAPVAMLDGQSTPDRVVAVAAGLAHTCAQLADGGLRCWGRGGDGQLGDGSGATSTVPVVASLAASAGGAVPGAADVTAGSAHSCALDGDGQIWCWGRGDAGQLGGALAAVLTPAPVPDVEGALAVSAGAAHTCAVTAAHTVICWGANDQGQLGGGDTEEVRSHVEVAGLTGAVKVSAGAAHTCALQDTGKVFCWGSNTSGQLGDGVVLFRTTAELARLSCN
jgi:alpha-tubulin suppressor-like RCC1 family protein